MRPTPDALPGMAPPPHACTPADCALPCRDGASLADHARQLCAWTDENCAPLAGLMLRAALAADDLAALADAVEYARRDLTDDWRILPTESLADYDARIAAASPAELLAVERADPADDPMPEREAVELQPAEPVPNPGTPAPAEPWNADRYATEDDDDDERPEWWPFESAAELAEHEAESAANAAAVAADPVGFYIARLCPRWRLDHVRAADTLTAATDQLRAEGVSYHGGTGPGYCFQSETAGLRIGTDLAARTQGPRHSWRAIAERIRAAGDTLL